MSKATDTRWRVQVRLERYAVWKNGGLYEVRADARAHAKALRSNRNAGVDRAPQPGYGFGNTRVVRYVKAKKGQGK